MKQPAGTTLKLGRDGLGFSSRVKRQKKKHSSKENGLIDQGRSHLAARFHKHNDHPSLPPRKIHCLPGNDRTTVFPQGSA
jgi:hypothetical protein